MLTDLVDSTALVEELGDLPAAELFAQVDRLTRDLLQERGGLEIDRTDGFLLAFESPIDAVRFTLAVHDALEALSRTSGRALRVRAGIHTGEVVLRANTPEDVARGAKPLEVEGLAKPFTARIMSCALGGQTLLSQTVFDLASRSAVGVPELAEVTWASHGDWLLKGVSDPVTLYEVTRGSPRRPVQTEKARPAGRRWRRWLGAFSAAVVLLIAVPSLGWWWWVNPTLDHSTPVFTIDGAPVLYEDPTQQLRLERVWHDYLEDQSLRSANDFQHLLDAEQVPPELLALTVDASSEFGMDAQDLAFMGRITPAEKGQSGARLCEEMLSEFLSLAANDQVSPTGMAKMAVVAARTSSGLHAWLDEHPDDALALGCLRLLSDADDVDAVLARLEAADPEGRTPRILGQRATLLAEHDRIPEALEVIRAGQRIRPDSAALDVREAMLYAQSGRPEEALAVLEPRIQEQPDRMELRAVAAQVLVNLGRDAALVEHLDVLLADHWPVGVGLLTLENVYRPLLRSGRPRLATEVLRRTTPDHWLSWTYTGYYAALPGFYTPQDLLAAGEVLAAHLDTPGAITSAFEREDARADVAMTKCFAALKAGEPIDPRLENQATHNERLEYPPSHVAAFLAGDLTRLEVMRSEADPKNPSADCGPAYLVATFRLASGERELALTELRAWLDRAECVLPETRAYRGLAAGELALEALRRGDQAEAARWVAAYHEAWPTAEPGLDIAIRLADYGVETGPQRLPALGLP